MKYFQSLPRSCANENDSFHHTKKVVANCTPQKNDDLSVFIQENSPHFKEVTIFSINIIFQNVQYR